MDISSAEPGPDAGEPKPDVQQAEGHTAPNSGNKELTKVLAYGPAQREPEAPEAPEIRAHQTPESGAAPEIKPGVHSEAAHLTSKKDTIRGSALVPFAVKDKAEAGAQTREEARPPRFEAFSSRGMQAALVAAVAGIAWAFAGSLYSGHGTQMPPPLPPQAAAIPDVGDIHQKTISVADNGETHRLTEEIRALKKELDGLRSSMAQNPAPEELRALKKSVDAVKSGLETTKTEMGSSLAQLSAKLDRAQHDPAKLREISDRLEHMEHAAPLTTASIAPPPQENPVKEPGAKPAQVPVPPAKTQSSVQPQSVTAKTTSPAAAGSTASGTSEKPQLITNWVVRDVYDGIALVEGPHGSVEVIEGETIPGAGTVKSIERRGNGWIVVTSRGLVDSARN